MRKKILLYLIALTGLVGIVFASSPFLMSMNPSAKAKTVRESYDVANMQAGSYLVRDYKKHYKLLIIKDWKGSIFSHLYPMKNEKIPMPDGNWWHGSWYACEVFGPETEVQDNRIKKNGTIKCHDETVPEWGKKAWEWSYDGRVILQEPSWLPDMITVAHEIRGNYIYINF